MASGRPSPYSTPTIIYCAIVPRGTLHIVPMSDDLQVTMRPVSALIPYINNARTHSDAQIAQVAASIREFGFTNPILIDPNNGIIAGHGRLQAAQRLGLTDVPCIVLAGLTEAQKKAYIIADNQLALNAGWNIELLKVEVEGLVDLNFNTDLLGFDADFIANLLHDETDGLTDPDDIPENAEPIAKPGDIFTLGNHRLICGDATDADTVDRLLAGVQPHLMVTDPPYGVDYDPKWRAEAGINKNKDKMGEVENDDNADWREAWALFPGDVAYVWHAGVKAGEVADSLQACDFTIRSQIIWSKDRFALSRGHYHWQHEPCWYAVRGDAHWTGDRSQNTVWNIPRADDKGHGHGTQKPVECMKRPIENNSSPGQAIYEPFMGSGTTLIAAEITGRHAYGVEINPEYVDIAITRWQNYTGQQATHESGQPYNEAA